MFDHSASEHQPCVEYPASHRPTRECDRPLRFCETLAVTSATVFALLSIACSSGLDELNLPPVAVAVSNAGDSAFIHQTVTLDGSGSRDPEGAELTYQWSLLEGIGSARVRWVDETHQIAQLEVDGPGELVIELVVSDGQLQSVPARVVVEVVNRPPVADAGPARLVDLLERTMLDGSASFDPDGDPITYRWRLVSAPTNSTTALTSADTAAPALVPDVRGTYVLELVVNDGYDDSAPARTSVLAGVENRRPVADAGLDLVVRSDQAAGLDGSGSYDPDGQPLSYRWRIVDPTDDTPPIEGADRERAEWRPGPGTFQVELVVSDGLEFSEPDYARITVLDAAVLGARLDPDAVHFLGTFRAYFGYLVLCSVHDPNRALAGFWVRHMQMLRRIMYVSPANGALYYLTQGYLRIAFPDPIAFLPGGGFEYSDRPEDNDLVLDTPGCPGHATGIQLRPDTGQVLHQCENRGRFELVDARGTRIPVCVDALGRARHPLRVGVGGTMLCDGGTVMDEHGTSRTISAPWSNFVAVRARPTGGFWAAVQLENDDLERWSITPDGESQRDGQYAAPPEMLHSEVFGIWIELDPVGAAYTIHRDLSQATRQHVVVRRSEDFTTSEIIYRESDDVGCQMVGPDFVSGP